MEEEDGQQHHEAAAGHGSALGRKLQDVTVGPYMLQDLVGELSLDTPEKTNVEITCVEARGK